MYTLHPHSTSYATNSFSIRLGIFCSYDVLLSLIYFVRTQKYHYIFSITYSFVRLFTFSSSCIIWSFQPLLICHIRFFRVPFIFSESFLFFQTLITWAFSMFFTLLNEIILLSLVSDDFIFCKVWNKRFWLQI